MQRSSEVRIFRFILLIGVTSVFVQIDLKYLLLCFQKNDLCFKQKYKFLLHH